MLNSQPTDQKTFNRNKKPKNYRESVFINNKSFILSIIILMTGPASAVFTEGFRLQTFAELD